MKIYARDMHPKIAKTKYTQYGFSSSMFQAPPPRNVCHKYLVPSHHRP